MLYIDTTENTIHTCAFYFGLEEYLIKDFSHDQDVFLLWTVDPTVMIGRHQVTSVELDQEYVDTNHIQVVRRNSGGGAVYTDPGCFQFSFITKKKNHPDIFKTHVNHIINALHKVQINAEFTGRNDILVNGRKFSGNAEYIYKDKLVVHGTILFDSNMEHLIGALTPDKSKLTKHAISSVESRVINIGTITDLTKDELYQHLVQEIATESMPLRELDLDRIHQYEQKFHTDEWNYGKNPKFSFERTMKFDSGNYTVHIDVKHNHVQQLRITGDFFSLQNVREFEMAFRDVAFTRQAFVDVTKQHRVRLYFHGLKRGEFLELIFGKRTKKQKEKPDYLKVDLKDLNRQTKKIRALLEQHNLHTVCQEASCPNQMECFSHKTATFMILGTRCTRNCAFCDVAQGRPLAVDKEEPNNILRAVKLMKLQHVVITSVTRDDLRGDYGSSHFVDVIKTIQQGAPDTTIEVLVPDFMGDYVSIKRVVDAKPDVINHNVETIERIYPGFRDRANYQRSLTLLKRVKEIDSSILTKSGIMLGIGETKEEVISLMKDLRAVGCDILTIGQYLQPSKNHREVDEYISLETFADYKDIGKQLGFQFVASGPMVRSSYEAHKQFKGESE
ncbi:lipoyl synthase [Candidatus Xianfuyuplasma coldseepsis]|uniref:Lipoyl synthase n=1 Tax=Candidatus Xianfuyuplasma coldseepsis TaxID=2782163 RepID=A0A7L7KU48_9MOLU|nr:lipoyl synthase [Xianfuyuplasma coldseepsis]QMS85939.1 lipoyl synthase [Xianfuyuplasma coldseepsis]